MAGTIDSFGATHIGKKRPSNEDQFLIADLTKSLRVRFTSLGLDHQTRLFGDSQGTLYLVADGMGGHEAGERASTLAVDGVVNYTLNTLRWLSRLDQRHDDDFKDDLKAAMEHCQDMLNREAEFMPQRRGMGTTMTSAFVIWPRLYVVHVGDSRCYVFRDGELTQLTRDHTTSQLYRETVGRPATGEFEPFGGAGHVLWNVIGGGDDELHPEVYRADVAIGDTLLLCTDGLIRHVSHREIAARLETEATAKQLCEQLIARANELGGSDNITVVVARFRHQQQNTPEAAAAAVPEPINASLADTAPLPAAPTRVPS